MNQMTEYQQNLVVENLSIVDWVIRYRIKVPHLPLLTYDDFYQVGSEALCRAAMAYRQELGEFAPLGSRYVYNAIIDHCRKHGHYAAKMVELDMETDNDAYALAYTSSEYDVFDVINGELLRKALGDCKSKYSGITQNGIEAMEMKYQGYSPKEIADFFGTNINNVNAWISRARSKLRKDPILLRAIS
jgi:RNA polymerase sigma factor (sigma-70 family)